jgi:hypothetical protein
MVMVMENSCKMSRKLIDIADIARMHHEKSIQKSIIFLYNHHKSCDIEISNNINYYRSIKYETIINKFNKTCGSPPLSKNYIVLLGDINRDC